jgi:AraC family transcriptional regulator
MSARRQPALPGLLVVPCLMPHRRIETVVEGRRQPAAGRLILSSAQTPWSGFLFERHEVSAGYAQRLFWPVPHVVLVATGQVSIEDRALATQPRFVARPGSVTIWPGDHESKSLSWSGACEVLDVEMVGSTLERLAQGDRQLASMALSPQPGIQDPQLAALVRAMEAEVKAGCPAGRLYGESLSLALAVYVSGRYSATATTRQQPVKGGLSRRQRERVLDYIHANLESDLSLSALAAVAQLSPRYFSLAFRNSVGVTPHQYVIRERISEAERLLVARRMPVAEVAMTLGFASQSHFTKIFHRATGTTPKRYRQER